MSKSVLHSAIGLIGGRLCQPITSFFLFLFSARLLPLEKFGVYVQLMGLIVLFQAVSTLGLTQVLPREIGKNLEKSGDFAGSALLLSIPATILAYLLFVGTIWFLEGQQVESVKYSLFLGLTLPLSVCIQIAEAVFTAHGEGKTLFTYNLAEQLTNTSLGILTLLLGYGLWGLFTAYLTGRTLAFAWTFYRLRYLAIPFAISISRKTLKMLSSYLPVFSTMTIIATLYFRMDIMILSYFTNEETLGIYGCAMRFLTICFIVPDSIAAAWFPHLSRLWSEKDTDFSGSENRSLQLSFALCLVGAACLILFAIFGLVPIFGVKFASSVPILAVLAFMLPAHSFNVHLGLLLQAVNRERTALSLVVFGAICLAVLTSFCTWQWGVMGTAYGMAVSAWCLALAHIFGAQQAFLKLPLSSPVYLGVMAFFLAAILPHLFLSGTPRDLVSTLFILVAVIISGLYRSLNPWQLRSILSPHNA